MYVYVQKTDKNDKIRHQLRSCGRVCAPTALVRRRVVASVIRSIPTLTLSEFGQETLHGLPTAFS